MRLRLRTRLLLPLAILLIAEALATTLTVHFTIQMVERQIDTQLQTVARTLTEPPTFPLTQRILEQMKGLSGAEFQLKLPDESMVATLPVPITWPSEAAPAEVRHGEELYRLKRLQLPTTHPNADGQLAILYPESQRQLAIRQAVYPLIVLGLVGALLSGGLVLLLAQQVTRRIGQLQTQTGKIAAGQFVPMPHHGPDDELRDLAETINQMTQQLAEQQSKLTEVERLRVLAQFSGGLAHQLRNAATGAKLALQLYLQDQAEADAEAIQVALRQLARMESNLQQFLALGKPPSTQFRSLDLVELARTALEFISASARHTGVRLQSALPESLPLQGDELQLGHLLNNLLVNAIEAAGPEGEVQFKMSKIGEEVEVTVADNGNGPPELIANRLFEAFVTGKEQGIGLGLAVAKQAVQAHGGDLQWCRVDGWTLFRVRLPLRPANHEAVGSF